LKTKRAKSRRIIVKGKAIWLLARRHRVASSAVALAAVASLAMLGVTLTSAAASENNASGQAVDLSATQARAAALSLAGKSGAVAESESVATTVGEATAAIAPAAQTSIGNSAASQWASEPAYLEVMHGSFTLDEVPRPSGASAPTGSTLSMVIGAESGEVAFVALNESGPTPASMAQLGTVSRSTGN
jgi:hypothetical protein